jgi:hypothetical protein
MDPEDPNTVERPLFKFLSQREVVAEMASNPDPFPRQGSVSTLRSTWRSQSDFIADVLNFALWPGHYPSQSGLATWTEELIDGEDFAAAAHDLAFFDMTTMVGLPSFRLTLAAVASAEGDEIIKGALAESWRRTQEPFKQLYAAVLTARGLKLREGITMDEFADMLTALASGLRIKAVAAPRARIIDYDRQRSLLGKAGLALILGCIEKIHDSTGTTVEEAANLLAGGRKDLPS